MAVAIDTLAYARRLREAGFTDAQAEGQAEALAAAMTDTFATKQDLSELRTWAEARFDHLERHFDTRLIELEKRMEIRLVQLHAELRAEFRGELAAGLADLERRMTLRLGAMMLTGITVVSILVKIL